MINMGSFLLFVFLFQSLIYSDLFSANKGKIAGKVTNQQTGEALIGANVFIPGTGLGAMTDKNGEYFIINVPPGIYSVSASYMGYGSVTLTNNVNVFVNRTTHLDFKLNETAVIGETVTVVAKRPVVVKDLTASERIIESAQIE